MVDHLHVGRFAEAAILQALEGVRTIRLAYQLAELELVFLVLGSDSPLGAQCTKIHPTAP